MQILAPYSWIKEYLTTDTDTQTFASEMSLIGNSVERQLKPDQYMNEFVLVGKVTGLHPHPNADALQLVDVSVGKETHRLVCGGDNLAVGQLVAVALPGAVVSWHGEGEMTLKAAKIRGEESFGMICAAEELGFPQLAKGKNIWDLTNIVREDQVGERLCDVLELAGDTVFDIEVTTNRPDCMAIANQAREAYAAKLGDFTDPFEGLSVPEKGGDVPVSVTVESPELCPRYMAVALDVAVGPSPWWMQKRLILAGAKPINNVVDVTNYVRLELGQPLHAFDYSKIKDGHLVVRGGKKDETFTALDEETYTLAPDMCVIADADGPVAVGGVMGGLHSGTFEGTERIILEAAAFDPLSIRNTWRTLNLQSDSQALYEKGLSADLPPLAMARAVELLKEVASATVVSDVVDVQNAAKPAAKWTLNPARVSALLGVEIEADEQVGILERLGFATEKDGDTYRVTTPVWREKDIEGDVDLSEEIARVWGYHNLPATLPTGAIPRREQDRLLKREEELKDLLCGFGFTEIYAYSFDDPEDVKKAGLDPAAHLRVENPLAEDQALMRMSLMPTMLRVIEQNQNHPGVEKLFELSRVYVPREGDLPQEKSVLCVAVVDDKGGEELFRKAKGVLEGIAERYNMNLRLEKTDKIPPYCHPGRTAVAVAGEDWVGGIGEVHPLVLKAFEIDRYVCQVTFLLEDLEPHMKLDPTYIEPSEFPGVYRDLAVVVEERVDYAHLTETMRAHASLLTDIELFDVYRGTGIVEGKKSVGMHLTFKNAERTLTAEEVDAELAAIVAAVQKEHGAEVRG